MARPATPGDAAEIHALAAPFVEAGLLLPRTGAEIESDISDYVVIVDASDRVRACAALVEYSPSLGEVASVAVDPALQGQGLGSRAVQSVEALARSRGLQEVFALSLAERFFEGLGYERVPLRAFPEKQARYAALSARGVTVTPKACFRKVLA